MNNFVLGLLWGMVVVIAATTIFISDADHAVALAERHNFVCLSTE
jgi:hypothetical protein